MTSPNKSNDEQTGSGRQGINRYISLYQTNEGADNIDSVELPSDPRQTFPGDTGGLSGSGDSRRPMASITPKHSAMSNFPTAPSVLPPPSPVAPPSHAPALSVSQFPPPPVVPGPPQIYETTASSGWTVVPKDTTGNRNQATGPDTSIETREPSEWKDILAEGVKQRKDEHDSSLADTSVQNENANSAGPLNTDFESDNDNEGLKKAPDLKATLSKFS
ncbi:uncharacterized protein I206_101522 [Kwoniella pini CBS 10737]|uniref:Uncharacterized protein n=1 Tax=Kwoniella pini CBS 10737 TaxID=1296096 RepID=A0A1B9HWF2_9TREE|nr:uncharacterized protein I206_06506 [Kwoniella pini CBS 10737]OCF47603.1 hypothetical protein I206_06506 [Kwoniella pini CBS 10737]